MPNTAIFWLSWDILTVALPGLSDVMIHLSVSCYKYGDPDNRTSVFNRLAPWWQSSGPSSNFLSHLSCCPLWRRMDPPPKKPRLQGSSGKPEPMDVDPSESSFQPMEVDIPLEEPPTIEAGQAPQHRVCLETLLGSAPGALNFHLGVEMSPSAREPLRQLLLPTALSSPSSILTLPQELSPLLPRALRKWEGLALLS